jgi:type I restriction enzyme S subunit
LGKPVKLTQPFDYALSANVVLIQPKKEYLTPNFVFTYMVCRLVERLLIEGSRATTQAAFGIQKVRLIPFPI